MPKNCVDQANAWFTKDGVLGYIIDCYVGVEKTPGKRGAPYRRVFRWEEDGVVFKGNADAFLIHLGLKFGLNLKPSNACMIHQILRELGEVVIRVNGKKPKDPNSPAKGRFKQPDPDKWRAR